MNVPPSYPKGLAHRAVYCSRTLNLRSIQVQHSSNAVISFLSSTALHLLIWQHSSSGPHGLLCGLLCRPSGTTWCGRPS